MPLFASPASFPRVLLGVCLPCSCVLCGAVGDEPVCPACTQAYATDRQVRCPCCANPVDAHDAGRRCGACLADPPAFDATLSACDYVAPADRLVLQLKFGTRLALAPWMARRLHGAARLDSSLALPDLLCAVPLGPRRLRERGYNQALEVARPLAALLGIPVAPRLVERLVDTAAQSGVTPGERRSNVHGAFALTDTPVSLHGRHVGVVDDVMTTGATLQAAALALKEAGAARVVNLVVARTA